MTPTREEVYSHVHGMLHTLMQDWDDDDLDAIELGPETKLFSELGFESLDAVVLGVSIQEHYGVEMPFGQMYTELGEQQRDLPVAELVDFVHRHVAAAASKNPTSKVEAKR